MSVRSLACYEILGMGINSHFDRASLPNSLSFLSLCFFFLVCRAYSAGDAFVGYHGNTAASVVLQVCNNLVQNQQRIELSLEEAWEEEVSG